PPSAVNRRTHQNTLAQLQLPNHTELACVRDSSGDRFISCPLARRVFKLEGDGILWRLFMPWPGRPRFTLAATMMFVLTAAAASALHVKIMQHMGNIGAPGWGFDVPTLTLLAIFLTAIALAALKKHSPVQAMLQATLTCLGCLTWIWISEAHYGRALRYWFQAAFGLTVTVPLIARAMVKSRLPRGPRRDWWKKTCEAIIFSFLNLLLVSAGAVIQVLLIEYGSEVFAKP